jgi:hypothetical protein
MHRSESMFSRPQKAIRHDLAVRRLTHRQVRIAQAICQGLERRATARQRHKKRRPAQLMGRMWATGKKVENLCASVRRRASAPDLSRGPNRLRADVCMHAELLISDLAL